MNMSSIQQDHVMQLAKQHANMRTWYNVSMQPMQCNMSNMQSMQRWTYTEMRRPQPTPKQWPKASQMMDKMHNKHASQRGPKLRHNKGAFYYHYPKQTRHEPYNQKQNFNMQNKPQIPLIWQPQSLKHRAMHNDLFLVMKGQLFKAWMRW